MMAGELPTERVHQWWPCKVLSWGDTVLQQISTDPSHYTGERKEVLEEADEGESDSDKKRRDAFAAVSWMLGGQQQGPPPITRPPVEGRGTAGQADCQKGPSIWSSELTGTEKQAHISDLSRATSVASKAGIRRTHHARACDLQQLCVSRRLGSIILECIKPEAHEALKERSMAGIQRRSIWRALQGLKASRQLDRKARNAASKRAGRPKHETTRSRFRLAASSTGERTNLGASASSKDQPATAPRFGNAATPSALAHRLGQRVVHSPVAQRVWGSLLFTNPTRGASSPHRRHFLSQSFFKGGLVNSAGMRKVNAAAAPNIHPNAVPQTADELSLTKGNDNFVLYEYVEELPLLLSGGVGMGHRVFAYFQQEKSGKGYTGAALGPLGSRRPTELQGPQTVPGILGGKQVRLQPGKGLAVMESPVVRAPIFRHEVKRKSDFLLVLKRQNGGTQANQFGESLHIRRIRNVCLVGQTEPLVEVCGPRSKPWSDRRKRCMKQMVREVMQRTGEKPEELDDRAWKDMSKWWPSESGRQEDLRKLEKALDQTDHASDAAAFPEDVCVLEALDRGIRRLETLGIGKVDESALKALLDSKAVKKAVEELEMFIGESSGSTQQTLLARRARWVMEQLQRTPWHLAQQYAQVCDGQRLFFSVSGHGDPSGGYGEGISYLSIQGNGIPDSLQAMDLHRLRNSELKQELLKLGASHEQIRLLPRADQLSLLRDHRSRKGDQAGDKAVDRAKSYDRLLQEAFDRQLEALGVSSPTISDDEAPEPPAAAELAGSSAVADQKSLTRMDPGATPAGANEEFEGLLDDLEADSEMATPQQAAASCPEQPSQINLPAASQPDGILGEDEGDADASEMARLRAALDDRTAAAISTGLPDQASANAAPESPAKPTSNAGKAAPEQRKVQMLKVITRERGPMGQLQETTLFVFGADMIRRYRQLQGQAAQMRFVSSSSAGRSSAAGAAPTVEGSESPNAESTEQRGPPAKKPRILVSGSSSCKGCE